MTALSLLRSLKTRPTIPRQMKKPLHGGARPGAGRPPKAAADKASARVVLRCTPAEAAALAAWAARRGLPLSELGRETLLRAARR